MVGIWRPETDMVLDVESFFDRLLEIETSPDGAHLALYAELLAGLANNEALFSDLIARGETIEGVCQLLSPPQSLILGHRGGFALRLNLWLPVKADISFRSEELSVYAYGFAHNHDFRFMTVGQYGPGYETDIYALVADDPDLEAGAPAMLEYRAREVLSRGTVIHFDPYRDVHVQHPPDAASISVNLLFVGDGSRSLDQLFFDVERGTVAGYVNEGYTGRVLSCIQLAEIFSTPEVPALLAALAQKGETRRVRAAARDAEARLRGGSPAGQGPSSA